MKKAQRPYIYLFFTVFLSLILLFAAYCSDKNDDALNPAEVRKQNTFRTIRGIEFVLVKAGTFTMGSPESEEGRNAEFETQREVRIENDFWISRYEITQAQFDEVAARRYRFHFPNPQNPAEMVNWHEAVNFAAAIGARLPSAAEWEYAARGGQHKRGNGRLFSGGDNLHDLGWYARNSSSGTRVGGQRAFNELGIFDMSGNVWEWCSDENNPWFATIPGTYRVIRGGAYNSFAYECRIAHIWRMDANDRKPDVGFRVVFDINYEEDKK